MQDKRGFMWFGTQDGLNRFDGFRFQSFSYQPNSKNSLINNIIYSLEEDQDGWIWIGTDRGACYYNPETDKFSTLDDVEYKISGLIYDIKTDLKNNIWVISDQGIYCYSKTSEEIKFYPSYRHFSPTSICITTTGDIWFSSIDGKLYNYDTRIASFRAFPVLDKEELERPVVFSKTIETDDNQLLVITRKAGIKKFNPNNGQITEVVTSDKNGQAIIINDIIRIENKYWIASESGIHILDSEKGLEDNIRNTPNNSYSLSNNAVKSVIQDSEGGIWFGSFYGGLSYLPRESTPFTKYYSSNTPGYLNGNVVKAICKDKNGTIWVGTEDAGLNKMSVENGTFKDYSFKNNTNGIRSTNIQAILADSSDLWIATHDNGVFLYDIEKEKVKQHFCALKKKNGLNKYQVESFLSLLKTQNGTIYIGSTIGLYKYNPEKENLDYMHNLAPQTIIVSMHEDKEGLVWLGTLGSGLFIYNQKSELSKHLYHDQNNPKSLGSDYITSIFEDSSNRIWLTTERDGLCHVNKEDYTFTTFNKDDGIPAGITCSIIEDGQGILWITSTNGLIKFNPTNRETVTFRKSNGLIDNHFCYNSSYKDNTGIIYFGSVNGMVSFNPADFESRDYLPPVYITALQTAGTSKHPEEFISQDERSILNSNEVRLNHDQSTFTIDFASPSYTNPSLTKYRYKLEGADKEWQIIPTNRRVYYTNVPPGNYRFLVTSMDDNKEWAANQASLNIKIIPPLSKSKGAIILYCLLTVFLCYTFFRIYKNKKQLEIQQKLDRMEQLREKELLNSKISFFTNITHEVRTPLTLIKAPLDRILNHEKCSETTTHNLLIMKKNTDRLLKLTNQLLDFRKTETDLLKLDYQSVDIKNTINDIYSRFLPTAKEKGIDFQLYTPDKDIVVNIDEETITKIISNLFNNAIKYTYSIIQVHVEYKKNSEKVVIKVNSDGDRIQEEFHEKIFEPFFKLESDHTTSVPQGSGLGLPLARSLAELHHGKLFIDNSVKDFNSFVLEIPSSVKEEPAKNKTIP
ncbi:MAG TPA: two-component regulator propeller domain-containing protein, partial [Draconibacterium sp.]|nr:two-component regulator propeller domain-containing protein [Draconibacterium sp.]